MKKPSRPRSAAKQSPRPVDDRALERVRGGNQVPHEPTTVSAGDDWEAPVV